MLTLGACTVVTPRPRTGVVYVREAPPREIVEVIGPAPSPQHVWIAGHYDWRGDRYVWLPGRYEVVREGYRRWEPGHWEHDRNGYFWIEGRWR
jgi:hypothetical protein